MINFRVIIKAYKAQYQIQIFNLFDKLKEMTEKLKLKKK